MNEFSLPTELNQLIVDGILNGYKEYLEERRAKKEKYIVSTGFSWSKANIIDTYVAKACSEFEGVSYKVDKAGYTWEYVQFTLKHAQESFLFIVKNSWGIDRTFNGKIDKNKKRRLFI
ncbi:hypothetical protein TP70_08555 [Staphylococcus microti]|uniref:Uncharacterized protein n=1 Tax=Staphylococcus microti TaxID=569857 RepID=A0A0D6XR09_9STAP|nr:hypothetical protein [Staphylococcus microti]KIX90273.1 hypothetical protein TP70_08555 [Staphylococcus microti]PNZ82522.1 hypothetical protein CD132_04315 [Staphylococcus microti]SUM57280.1 Uncharacterised protein [Staphylococcus microti]